MVLQPVVNVQEQNAAGCQKPDKLTFYFLSISVRQKVVQHTTTKDRSKLSRMLKRVGIAHRKLKVGDGRSFSRNLDHLSRTIKAQNAEASTGELGSIPTRPAACIHDFVAWPYPVLAKRRDNSGDTRIDRLAHQ